MDSNWEETPRETTYIATKMTNYIRIGAALYPMRYSLIVEAVDGGNYIMLGLSP
jgi:hypothetical protein